MNYRFYLDDLEIEEPRGWDEFELSMRRDDKTHGIQFEVSTGSLQFYGAAANYLIDQKNTKGIKANVSFIAQEFCNDPYQVVEEITGRLNFGKFKSTCGQQCTVEVPIEEESCKVIFRNRYDQKVDVDSNIAFDGITALPTYAALGIELDLKAKALQAAVDGSVKQDGYTIEYDVNNMLAGSRHMFRPSYEVERYNNIQTGQLIPFNDYVCNAGCPDFGPMTPQLLMEDTIECFNGQFDYNLRMKGLLTVTGGGPLIWVKVTLFKWDAVGDIFTDAVIIDEVTVVDHGGSPVNDPVQPFDVTLTGTMPVEDGVGVYAVMEAAFFPGSFHVVVDFHDETYFTLSAIKVCPDTLVEAYLVHETLSRVAESTTNNCVRVKSDYYGRIDSQPFAFDNDGCGGLRMLTSGLKIRRAPDDRFFASMKDLFEGLNAIDNIGFDLIPDPDYADRMIMRIEDVGFFYQDDEVFFIESVPIITNEVQENMHYSKILVGYNKWEVEGINGLDEFNSTREYRTSFETISNTLDIKSNLVAGSYPIEHTRQQNFADSGAADTKFDNDTFIITLKRNAYDFEVEQDNVSDAANFFDPDTIYNFRLSPVRNLMRWYKTIAAGLVPINSSENKLFFSAGTGNLLATGEVIEGAYDAACKLESMPIMESQNLFITHFAREEDYLPLWKNETDAYEFPLNIAEYKAIKANPYGYINYQCGTGNFTKGFIKEIKFKPAKGKANFVFIKKYE